MYLPIARDMVNLTEDKTIGIQFGFAPNSHGAYNIDWTKTAKTFAENSWISLTLQAADGVYKAGGNDTSFIPDGQ